MGRPKKENPTSNAERIRKWRSKEGNMKGIFVIIEKLTNWPAIVSTL